MASMMRPRWPPPMVGIAMGAGGTDVALETADVVLMSSDLSKLPFAIKLSRKAAVIIRQNVIFSVSVILTLVLLTILLPVLIPGFLLPLPLGVVGHEGSTLIVVANGLRLLAMRSGTIEGARRGQNCGKQKRGEAHRPLPSLVPKHGAPIQPYLTPMV